MSTILVVEDNDGMRQMLVRTLESEGYTVVSARDGRTGIHKLDEVKVDLVLADLKLPYKDGLTVLRETRERDVRIPVILITAYATIETAVKAIKEGAYDFLEKENFDQKIERLLAMIEQAMEKQRLLTENLLLREEVAKGLKIPTIIGKGQKLLDTLEKAQRVSGGTTTVLLQGESGTGKELLARMIHGLSPRANGPFVAINCAAIPRDLLESELFGYEKGAFTGAVSRRVGKFELAAKGTIFLDEIGELDLSLQVKLLRILEGGGFMRVGGTTMVPGETRVLAATNRNLEEAVAQGKFREDLYYRIAVFPITMPPLREHREDIPVLAEHFLFYFTKELKKGEKQLSQAALDTLMAHPWTGNVRELQNAIERAVILSDGLEILPEHLGVTRRIEVLALKDLRLDGTLHDVGARAAVLAQAQLLRRVLRETGWNKTRASEVLEVNYKTLLIKIKEFGLEPEPERVPDAGGEQEGRA